MAFLDEAMGILRPTGLHAAGVDGSAHFAARYAQPVPLFGDDASADYQAARALTAALAAGTVNPNVKNPIVLAFQNAYSAASNDRPYLYPDGKYGINTTTALSEYDFSTPAAPISMQGGGGVSVPGSGIQSSSLGPSSTVVVGRSQYASPDSVYQGDPYDFFGDDLALAEQEAGVPPYFDPAKAAIVPSPPAAPQPLPAGAVLFGGLVILGIVGLAAVPYIFGAWAVKRLADSGSR